MYTFAITNTQHISRRVMYEVDDDDRYAAMAALPPTINGSSDGY